MKAATGAGLRGRIALLRSALGNRRLGLLLVSWLAWIIALWAFLLAASVLAFDRGGAGAVGLVGAALVLPGAVLGPLLTLGWQRLPRPLVLASTHGLRAVVCLAAAGLSETTTGLLPIVLVVAVASVVGTEFRASTQTLVPQVVHHPRELIPANTAYSSVEGLGTIGGPLLAGALLALGGPAPTFLVLAGLYLLAAGVVVTIRTDFQPARRTSLTGIQRLLEPLRGARVLVATPGIRAVFALFMAQTAMRGFLNVFVVLLALTSFGGGEAQAGSLFAAVGIGGSLGLLVALGAPSGARTARWFTSGVVTWGATIVVIGLWPHPAVAFAALAALGLGNAIEDIFGYSLLNRLIPDHQAGPAWVSFWSVAEAAVAFGSLAAPLLVDASSLPTAMVVAGGTLLLLVALLWPVVRTVDALVAADPAVVALLAQVPLFAPMSHIALERLARAARPVDVAAGDVVISVGDVGEEFFVVADGEVTVVGADGVQLRRMGAGEGFGEVALLERVRRTATVTATEPTRLYVVGQEDFVAAVTGHRGAALAGRRTVEEYLGGPALET